MSCKILTLRILAYFSYFAIFSHFFDIYTYYSDFLNLKGEKACQGLIISYWKIFVSYGLIVIFLISQVIAIFLNKKGNFF